MEQNRTLNKVGDLIVLENGIRRKGTLVRPNTDLVLIRVLEAFTANMLAIF